MRVSGHARPKILIQILPKYLQYLFSPELYKDTVPLVGKALTEKDSTESTEPRLPVKKSSKESWYGLLFKSILYFWAIDL